MLATVRWLGYAGLIPFVGLPLLMVNDSLSFFEGMLYFSQYSAIILSFLGGVIWFHAIQQQKADVHLYIAMLPSIVGWLSLVFLAPITIIGVLAAALLAVLVYDLKTLTAAPQAYLRLRARLTSITLGCHFAVIWLYYNL